MFPASAVVWTFWSNPALGAAPILSKNGAEDEAPASDLPGGAFGAPESTDPSADNPSVPPPPPVFVLLIEDNEADVYITNQVLKTCGFPFRLEVISDGEAGVEFVKRTESDPEAECPGLILLDLNLPRISGIELFRELRKSRLCRHIPVIVVTSSESPQDVTAIRDLNAAAYFRKPTSLSGYMQLANMIRNVMEKSGY